MDNMELPDRELVAGVTNSDKTFNCPLSPLGSRIVCMAKKDADNTAGLVLPDSAKKSQFLTVVALGPDCEGLVEVGQHVLIPLYSSEMIAVDTGDVGKEQRWFMMAEKSVPAIIKD